MKNRTLLAGLVVLVVIVAVGGFWLLRRGSDGSEIDLIAELQNPATFKRSTYEGPAAGVPFSVSDVTVAGQTRKAIYAPPHSRIKWKVTVPRRGTVTTWFALREDAWQSGSDGAQFRIGVSDLRTYEEYLREFVNPRDLDRDRRWFEATIDLSAYEGQEVELIFNTDPGPPPPARNHSTNDYCVWAEPRLVAR